VLKEYIYGFLDWTLERPERIMAVFFGSITVASLIISLLRR